MSEVDEHLKPLADNVVTALAANAGDETHATGIMLIPWMIKALRLRSFKATIRCMHGILLPNELCGAVCIDWSKRTQPRSGSWWGKPPLPFIVWPG
jgi:hypothetical protein